MAHTSRFNVIHGIIASTKHMILKYLGRCDNVVQLRRGFRTDRQEVDGCGDVGLSYDVDLSFGTFLVSGVGRFRRSRVSLTCGRASRC